MAEETMTITPRDLRTMLAQTWAEGFSAAEGNDCCGCNLSIDEDGEETPNPYEDSDS